jgi:hypothetical protein
MSPRLVPLPGKDRPDSVSGLRQSVPATLKIERIRSASELSRQVSEPSGKDVRTYADRREDQGKAAPGRACEQRSRLEYGRNVLTNLAPASTLHHKVLAPRRSEARLGEIVPSTAGKSIHFAKPAMLVVVHDFSTFYLSELTYIVEKLEPILGRHLSAAIVPRWHGNSCCTSNATYRDLVMRSSEQLLHGWTHQSAGRMRPLSLLTGASDEFWGLDEAMILERLELAQADFRKLTGKSAEGFLPPAWQLPIRASRLSSLKFVMRFCCIESCQVHGRIQPLATSSWDWGRLGWLGYGGEWLGHLLRRTSRAAIPCIAIHPIDVHRGYFARAVRLIEALARNGYRAVTATELMSALENES